MSCQCPIGFVGERCQDAMDPCIHSPCVRGSCFSHKSQFVCECPSGYDGKLCETKQSKQTIVGPREEFIKIPLADPLNLNCSLSDSTNSYRTSFQWRKSRGCYQLHANNNNNNFYIRHYSTYKLTHADIGAAGTYICTLEQMEKYFHVDIAWCSEICTFEDRALCKWDDTGSYISWREEHGRLEDHSLGTKSGTYMTVQSDTPGTNDASANLTSANLPANQTILF
ncbi:sushi, nidogen and EGF-like domain-containing protein 1 [Ruditapes philippinarum]|uniref:sushi, nidogen and EGF-like domain-containing protein 1 n=1 Tax=Ruditapes philippinarum TaxID=129788 RepID=UPI00295A572C|nr:sushi, nidogen and EGF-like domain-containing protein 1 [Ruditapes philippinarum]